MTALADMVISLVELVEAEANQLGSRLRGWLVSLVLIGVAGILLLAGLGWLVAAGYLQLRLWLEPALAAGVMGLVTLGIAGGMLWYLMLRQ